MSLVLLTGIGVTGLVNMDWCHWSCYEGLVSLVLLRGIGVTGLVNRN